HTHCLHCVTLFFFSSRRRHTRSKRDWSSDVCSSDLSLRDADLRPDLHPADDPGGRGGGGARLPRGVERLPVAADPHPQRFDAAAAAGTDRLLPGEFDTVEPADGGGADDEHPGAGDLPVLAAVLPQRHHGGSGEVTALGAKPLADEHMPGRRAPNIVLIHVDDLGWTDLGCFGSGFYETPRLDALADQGCRLPNAYAASPVCSPSRASLMTGRVP